MSIDNTTIEVLIQSVSMRSLKHWLRMRGKTHSYDSRKSFITGVLQMISKGEITFEEFKTIVLEIEEYASKVIYLFEGPIKYGTKSAFKRLAESKNLLYIDHPTNAIRLPEQPTLNYLSFDERFGQIFAKFSETHDKIEIDKETLRPSVSKQTNIIVISQDVESGLIQIRMDRDGDRHSHKNSDGKSSHKVYLDFYKKKAMELLDLDLLVGWELEPFMNLIVSDKKIFRLPDYEITTSGQMGASYKSKVSRGDIREDSTFVAANSESDEWVKESLKGFWLPTEKEPMINREIYMGLKRADSKIYFMADCLPEEINYVLRKIVETRS